MLINDIRLAVAVATLALLSSIPAAGQAIPPPKLSPQQLNPPTLNVNKPIAAPKAPTAYSPNLNKPIAAPMASGTIALIPNRDMKRIPPSGFERTSRQLANDHGGYDRGIHGKSPYANTSKMPPAQDDSNLPSFGVPSYGGSASFGPVAPCPSGASRDRNGYC